MNLRKLGVGAVTAAVFAGGLWAGVGSAGWLGVDADPIALKATLSARAEVPKPTGVRVNAGGSFSASLTRKGTGGTLAWRLTFRNLTGRAMAAHVHLARAGVAGPVAVALCGPCRSGARGSSRVKAATVSALLNGRAYVNVHTAKNAGGEIRGQIKKGGTVVGLPTGTTTTTTQPPTTTDPYP